MIRINLKTEERLQDWRDTVRGRLMVVDLDSFEKVVFVLFGIFA